MPDHDVFLSYHWRDHSVVEALALRLRDAGLNVFLDRWYLTPGTHWLQALESALARCGAVAVCTGSEMGPWQQREAYSALERQVAADRQGQRFPVIPVLLPGSEAPLGFLSQNTWVDLRDGLDDPLRLTILAKAIRGEAPGPELQASIEQVTAAVCPYRGLLYFREEDSPFFFGREAPTASLIEAVNRQEFVAVVGASGSGKSSLVRAGLVPALRRQRDVNWEIVTLFPGDRPLYNLAAALLPLLEPDIGEVAALLEIKRLAQALRDGNILLRDVVQRALLKQPGTQRLLLVVDQWEELFTLNEDVDDRQRFIDGLLEATRNSPLSAVLTLRGDFFGRAVTSHRQLADRLQGAQVNLGPMQEGELRQAVVEPAKRLGLEFEPNLVELILEQALGEPGHLPLLEFVLRGLWEKRQGRLMHRAAYDAMGQLEGAIAARAEALFDSLTRNDPQAEQRIRSIVLRLVRPGEGEQDTRRRAALTDFDAPAVKLIRRLADDRLLVSSAPSTTEAPKVEVAHEALILHWARLREWVRADRDFMAWRQRTGDQAQEWDRLGRTADLALRGLPLAQARAWLNRRRADLSDLECDFIRAGARRRNLFLATVAGTSIVSVAVIVYFAVAANAERQRAELARDDAEGLVEYMVYDLRDALAPVGRLDLMAGINQRVDDYYGRVGDAGSQQIQRRRMSAANNQGDTLLAQGKLDAARQTYGQALAIAERLAQADPSNTQWQRDLSVSHEKLGDVEVAAGKLDAARKAYERALAIRERLAQADPSNTEWQRDLSVSYRQLGNVDSKQSKAGEALAMFERSAVIAERLATLDPSNATWKNDLEWVRGRVASLRAGAKR